MVIQVSAHAAANLTVVTRLRDLGSWAYFCCVPGAPLQALKQAISTTQAQQGQDPIQNICTLAEAIGAEGSVALTSLLLALPCPIGRL